MLGLALMCVVTAAPLRIAAPGLNAVGITEAQADVYVDFFTQQLARRRRGDDARGAVGAAGPRAPAGAAGLRRELVHERAARRARRERAAGGERRAGGHRLRREPQAGLEPRRIGEPASLAIAPGGVWVAGSFANDSFSPFPAGLLGDGGLAVDGGLDLAFIMVRPLDGFSQSGFKGAAFGGPGDERVDDLTWDADAGALVVAGTFSGPLSFGGATLTPGDAGTSHFLASLAATSTSLTHLGSQAIHSNPLATLRAARPAARVPVAAGSFTGTLELGGTQRGPAGPNRPQLFIGETAR